MDDIVSRLKSYMTHIGLPSTQFADFAGIPRPTISQIINGRNKKISNELIAKLHSAFPTLNILWLMFGDGEMEIKQEVRKPEPQKIHKTVETSGEIIDNDRVDKSVNTLFTDDLQLRNSNIEEFAEENLSEETQTKNLPPIPSSISTSNKRDPQRKIRYIMVYYNDNTFEVLTPDN